MTIFYISKYAFPSKEGNSDRKYILSKFMNRYTNSVKLVYSRSNGRKYKKSFKLYDKETIEGLECVRINGVKLKQTGINLQRMFSWIQFEINLFIYFILLPKRERPNIVIASSFSLFTFYTIAILKRMYNFRMVIEVRDICPLTELNFGRIKETSIVYKVFKFVELFGYKHADKIFATMPKFNEYLTTQGFFNKEFICIPQGYDPDYLPSLETNQESNKIFTVMYAGTIGEVNLVEELCIAANLLKKENIEFVLYGEGPLRENLERKYASFNNIHFKGAVSKNEVSKVLMKANLLVNMWADKPVYQYGVSPNKWIDYMLSAVPILVTFNGYQSIINEAECGWFIPANKPELLALKILEISKMNESDLKKMGLRGREYVIKKNNYKTLSQELLNFIIN